MDTVEIRVHPSNFQRVIRDAHERGAKVSRLIDELPVIPDARLDIRDNYVVSHSGTNFWD
jgi:hypothetical protein